jgi:uncharacterized protein YbaP (TraB family)
VIRCAVALVVVAACSSAPRCELPVRVGPAAPFLWRVQRDGGPIVWLYGTIHDVGGESVPRAAWTALESSAKFASELGDVEPDPDELRELARLPSGPGLDQQLPADDWYDLRDTLGSVIKPVALARARPWYAMSLLSAHAGPSVSPSMDDALAKRARARGVDVDALEAWHDQLVALDATVKIADLVQAIHARRTMACDLTVMQDAYKAGDLPAMTSLLVIAQAAPLLAPRNAKWLPQLERYLTERGAFVAVGLGHLAGDDGLVATLVHAGYHVERMGP